MGRRRRGGTRSGGRKQAAPVAPRTAPAVPRDAAAPARAPRPSATGLGWGWAAAVFAVAFAVRAGVAADLADLALYQRPQLDQLEFLIWARGILERGFSWPSLPTKGPGYALFLASQLALFDGSLAAVRLAQAALGGLTAALTALLAARLWGRQAALAAGLAVALYGPLAWIDTMLLAEGLFVLLLAAALFALTRPGWPWWATAAAAGALVGAAALVRATALALLPAFALWLLLRRGEEGSGGWRGRRGWGAAGLLAAAALAVVLPVTAAMRGTTGSALLVQGYGGLNLWMGNDPDGSGLPAARPGAGWDRLEGEAVRRGYTTAAAQDRYFTDRTRQAIRERPLDWLRLLAEKAGWLLQADEIRDSHSYYFFRARSRLLGLLPGWGVLLPLAAWGMVAAAQRRRLPWEQVAYLAVFAATCVAIIMGGRYRLPMVPVLAVFAGGGVTVAIAAARARRWRELAVAGVVIAVAAMAAQVRRHEPSRNLAEEWAMSGAAELARGDGAAAEAVFRRALAADPGSALAWEGLSRVHLERREPAPARQAAEQALALNPDFALAHDSLARALLAAGDADGALDALGRALALRPDQLASLELAAPLLLRQGRVDAAGEAYTHLAELTPGSAAAQLGLARVAGARRRPDEGVAHAARAAELEPGNGEAWMTLALLAVDSGELATAERALARAEAVAGGVTPEILWARALAAHRAGRRDEVDALLRRLLALRPGFPPAVRLLLDNAAARGRREEAEAFLARLGAAPPG